MLFRSGRAVEDVVTELLRHAFFAAPPPKSTGREAFGDDCARRLIELVRAKGGAASNDDCLATAVRLTARAVAEQLGHWVKAPKASEILVSGGGARNATLMTALRKALPAWSVRQFSEVFFDGEAKEAVAFALLGWLTIAGEPGNVPSATGAKGPRVLGRITPA